MANQVKAIPEGYQSVTPYLIVDGAGAAIDFYKKAFDAVELFRMAQPDGRIGHAEIRIGNSPIMLADEFPDMEYLGPAKRGGSSVSLLIYVEEVDSIFKQAINAGATEQRAVENKFYGDRMGTLVDPYGHIWHIGTHVEDVSAEEMERRAAAMQEHS